MEQVSGVQRMRAARLMCGLQIQLINTRLKAMRCSCTVIWIRLHERRQMGMRGYRFADQSRAIRQIYLNHEVSCQF